VSEPASEITVLLVDDSTDNVRLLEVVLAPLGFRLLRAYSGEEALRHLLVDDIALILLDVRMPGMDGFETARHVKERERTRDIPIVFLTAYGDDATRVAEGFSSGAVDYLTKPVDPLLLRAKVRVLVDLHRRTRALQEESEVLAQRLDERYASEARILRKLTDAALAINSTLSLADMLLVINQSAREICGAHQAETVLLGAGDTRGTRTRSCSSKYETWAAAGGPGNVEALHEVVWKEGGPVRMTAKDVELVFGDFGVDGVAPGHPLLEGWLAVPLVGRTGQPLGLIQVADKVDDEFTESDEVVLTQLAQLAAVAIENAERYRQEHDIAETLQRSLLPHRLPAVPGLDVAVRYRPGGAGTSVGGDWYDVVPLDHGRVALTVGDIMGRGSRAAAVMGQLRTALRAYALQDLPPALVMRSIDRLLQGVDDDAMATATFLVLDVSNRRLEVVSAGHPPPLLVDSSGPRFIECDPHTPLGVHDLPIYRATTMTVEPGSLLVLYTDGLVEERTENLADGLARLAVTVDYSTRDVEALCDDVLGRMVPAEKQDDIALLAARLRGSW
jgi:serine phosphatase RsbU (regulator of sigma subunit)/DNA-binding response OmpR family regulator